MNQGSTNKDVRILNRGLLLQQIATRDGVSRVDLARLTGLTKTTITNVVGELLEGGFLVEHTVEHENAQSAGRKPVLIDISPTAPLIIGILIRRQRLDFSVGNLKGELLEHLSHNYSGLIHPEDLVETVLNAYHSLRKNRPGRIAGVGVSTIGLLDTNRGTILNPPRFFSHPCELDIISALEQQIDVPIFFMHDTSASVLGEKIYGENSLSNFIYVSTLGGIGAGLMLDNKVYTGDLGQSGELGHMSIDVHGPICSCGSHGCLELYANLQSLTDGLHEYESLYPTHPLMRCEHPPFGDFVDLANRGDFLCTSLLRRYCAYLASALASIVNLLDLGVVVLEYESASNGGIVEKLLESEINRRILAKKYRHVQVRQSRFGSRLPLVGTLAIVSARVFSGDLTL